MGKRNPNNYGCVTKLSGNRARPWVVKVTMYDEYGKAKQTPVGYADTEENALILLAKYNNNPWNIKRETVTLAELFNKWLEVKAPKLSYSNSRGLKSAYKHCSKYYGMKYRQIKSYQMQDCIDNCGCGSSMQWKIKNLFSHLDEFAFEMDIIDKMYSQITTADAAPETTREIFTRGEIAKLWELKDEPYVNTVLIYLYTGFRLTELLDMKKAQVDIKELTFTGGIKTKNGKNRIVPIHSKIQPLVKELYFFSGSDYLFSYNFEKFTPTTYYIFWKDIMKKIGAEHTPHEARHTFETALDNAKANKKCIDMLMGHKSKDVGNRVYNHKTITQLKEAIEMIDYSKDYS